MYLTEYGQQHFETPFSDHSLEVIHLADGQTEVAIYPKALDDLGEFGLCMGYNGCWEVDEDGDWSEEGDLVTTRSEGYGWVLVKFDRFGRFLGWSIDQDGDRPYIDWDEDYYRDDFGQNLTKISLEEEAVTLFDRVIKDKLEGIDMAQVFTQGVEFQKVA